MTGTIVASESVESWLDHYGVITEAVNFGLSPNAVHFFPPTVPSTSNVCVPGNIAGLLVEGHFVDPGLGLDVAVNQECISVANNFIEVPVSLVDSLNLGNTLGDSSGLDIRNHMNWLDSSDGDPDSEFSDGGGLAYTNICGGLDLEMISLLLMLEPLSMLALGAEFVAVVGAGVGDSFLILDCPLFFFWFDFSV
ncbi:hypothetical protein MA16_Dca001042 [Dendrobium catenatum]|uniref:Uncharacterized protein n=1 Tax=Dendrobium catenatum TaxID=906689 RepID=A0A2I0WLA2_9ASPA|nr:hypothetical protein MA16_Dca001042 [Dendrobium catenatum]